MPPFKLHSIYQPTGDQPDAIEALAPEMVVPTHCTGFKAMAEFARRMPDAFVQGVVGTKYLF